ncbi:MAG: insulinase family protein, partial [Acetobacteraceae bacterium]|nr:insulinase family protein [Acetobacteraceae bacterium]
MSSLPRAFSASFLALFLLGAAASGKQKAVVPPPAPAAVRVDPSAWLYKGSDITPDPAWSFGTLPNGLRYAVRKNGVPPGQVSIRVRIDAGSLYETDAERGFAHFIEHLSYRASEYVPDGEAKRIFQNFGATFGTDTNAQTSP